MKAGKPWRAPPRDVKGVDLDGKPGGLQPEGNAVLPGQPSH